VTQAHHHPSRSPGPARAPFRKRARRPVYRGRPRSRAPGQVHRGSEARLPAAAQLRRLLSRRHTRWPATGPRRDPLGGPSPDRLPPVAWAHSGAFPCVPRTDLPARLCGSDSERTAAEEVVHGKDGAHRRHHGQSRAILSLVLRRTQPEKSQAQYPRFFRHWAHKDDADRMARWRRGRA
jgi:hypothetical protein